jgi:hypothetical protein
MLTGASRLSSFFANRLRAALWIAAVAVAIALLAAVIVGLRPHHAAVPNLRRTLVAALATAISSALVHKQPKVAPQLVAEMGRVEADTSVARAQRAGALEYNARLKRIRSGHQQRFEQHRRGHRRARLTGSTSVRGREAAR